MPTVLRLPGLRVVIYPNDHRPAHVHVMGHGHEVVFELGCPGGPIGLRENFGFPRHEAKALERLLTENLEVLCRSWERMHGHAG